MFVPVTDLARVCELILAGLCWYRYMSGKLDTAHSPYDIRCAKCPTSPFIYAVKAGQYGVLTED